MSQATHRIVVDTSWHIKMDSLNGARSDSRAYSHYYSAADALDAAKKFAKELDGEFNSGEDSTVIVDEDKRVEITLSEVEQRVTEDTVLPENVHYIFANCEDY